MIICGLDQAPSGTGFCYGDGSGPPTWGYREFSHYGDNEGALVRHVYDWFKTFAKSAAIETVYTEQVTVSRGKGRGQQFDNLNMPVLFKQIAVIVAIGFAAHDLGIEHYEATISAWRKHFNRHAGGGGDHQKQLAVRRCADRGWLIDPKDHHTAEACGIWDYAMCQEDPVYRHRTAALRRRLDTGMDDMLREERSA